jgi:hypothetical protein
MESDYLSGMTDPQVAAKYGVSDRTFRRHRSHSPRITSASNSVIKAERAMPAIDSLHLNSDEIKLLSIFYMTRSIERLNAIASETGSVRAEATLGDSIVKLSQLLKGWDFA